MVFKKNFKIIYVTIKEDIMPIIKEIEKRKLGKKKTLFRLKDWVYQDNVIGVALYQWFI